MFDQGYPRKRPSPLVIAGVVCGGVLLLIAVGVWFSLHSAKTALGDYHINPARAAAMLAVKTDPEFNLVRTDDAKGEITLRDRKTGEEMTMRFEDYTNRKAGIATPPAVAEVRRVEPAPRAEQPPPKPAEVAPKIEEPMPEADEPGPPRWVPAYPRANTPPGSMKMEKQDSIAGAVTVRTMDTVGQVKVFYEGRLKSDGFEIESTGDGNQSAVINARKDNGRRTITALINSERGMTVVILEYEGPKR